MITWTNEAWEDYIYWQAEDKKTIKRINKLIKDILRNGNTEGIGKPEPLRYDLQGFYSRRIDDEHRIVYIKEGDTLTIISCRYHYV